MVKDVLMDDELLDRIEDFIVSNGVVFEKLPNPGLEVWEPRIPEFAHLTDAGMDFYAATSVEWEAVPGFYFNNTPSTYQAVVPTGLRVKLPYMTHMRIASRSGLGFKHNIIAFPGTIDNGYTGEIKIKLFAFGDSPMEIKAGDKIAQGITFLGHPILITEGIVSEDTDRGSNGFGSTDAKL